MLSPQLRNKVHSLWTMFWTAGMTNPLVAVEQITYLLFLRQLEHLDRERVKQEKPSIYYSTRVSLEREVELKERLGISSRKGASPDLFGMDYAVCRWSYIRQNPSFELLNGTVFPWLRGLEEWLNKNSVTTAFSASSIKNPAAFIQALTQYGDGLARTIVDKLSPKVHDSIWTQAGKPVSEKNLTALINDLNAIIQKESLYHPQRFESVKLRPETKELAERNPNGDDLVRLNRLLLEDAYPDYIVKCQPEDDRLSISAE